MTRRKKSVALAGSNLVATIAVYDGQRLLGELRQGPSGVEAFDAEGRLLGAFRTQGEAGAAILEAARGKGGAYGARSS